MKEYGQALRVGRTAGVCNRHARPERRVFQLKVMGDQW